MGDSLAMLMGMEVGAADRVGETFTLGSGIAFLLDGRADCSPKCFAILSCSANCGF